MVRFGLLVAAAAVARAAAQVLPEVPTVSFVLLDGAESAVEETTAAPAPTPTQAPAPPPTQAPAPTPTQAPAPTPAPGTPPPAPTPTTPPAPPTPRTGPLLEAECKTVKANCESKCEISGGGQQVVCSGTHESNRKLTCDNPVCAYSQPLLGLLSYGDAACHQVGGEDTDEFIVWCSHCVLGLCFDFDTWFLMSAIGLVLLCLCICVCRIRRNLKKQREEDDDY